VADGVRQQFGGYERDNETGLDFAQARYYSNVQGRFTSPDPLLESAKVTNPQSWNRYTYVLNNPLVFIDPTGLLWIASGDAGNPYRWVDECPQGGTCHESVASVVNLNRTNYAVVYGSNNAQDITAYAPNQDGMIDLSVLDNHHNAQFGVRDGNQNSERYTNAETAATLFNATRDYADQYPQDANIVITAASQIDGTGSAAHPNSHGQPNTALDFRYMDAQGRPIRNAAAAAMADVNRTSDLFDFFRDQGINQTVSGRPRDFGTGPANVNTPRGRQIVAAHQNHGHVGIVARLRGRR
jgi:RHS repeat-associated protein